MKTGVGKEDIQAALDKLDELCSKVTEQKSPLKVYSNKELCLLFSITDKTLRLYRNEGLISYSRVDDKIWYTQDDVDEFLKKHHYDAFSA